MKRAIAAIGVCAGALTAGAVISAAPAGADCTSAGSLRSDCATVERAAATRTVTVTETSTTTTTTTTTTTSTATDTTTVTETVTRTAAARRAGAVWTKDRDPAAGPTVTESPN